MSHFTVAVITLEGQSVDELLAKYDENIEIERYSAGIVNDEELKRFRDYYIDKYKLNGQSLDVFDLYKIFGDDWNDSDWEINDDGLFEEYSIYNPDSKWDWYSIGGRWAGLLNVKDGYNGKYGEKSWTNRDEEYEKNRYDVAKIKDLVEYPKTFAMVTPDGEWSEKGQMGWFGMSNETDKSIEAFEKYQKEMFDKYKESGTVTIVDCHI